MACTSLAAHYLPCRTCLNAGGTALARMDTPLLTFHKAAQPPRPAHRHSPCLALPRMA